jgi:endonuclease YncB( thermonuclease family)
MNSVLTGLIDGDQVTLRSAGGGGDPLLHGSVSGAGRLGDPRRPTEQVRIVQLGAPELRQGALLGRGLGRPAQKIGPGPGTHGCF